MVLELVRLRHAAEGVFGVLLDDFGVVCATLERSYDDLQAKVPVGVWPCERTVYHRGGDLPTFEIIVPGHSRILFHPANWETQLDGCVALGVCHRPVAGRLGIAQSRDGFDEFMRRTNGLNHLTLRVTEVSPR